MPSNRGPWNILHAVNNERPFHRNGQGLLALVEFPSVDASGVVPLLQEPTGSNRQRELL